MPIRPPFPCLVSRPEMREFADLRATNFNLAAENARLRAERSVVTDFERGELKAFREANDALTATNLSLQLQRAELVEQLESLGGVPVFEQLEGLREALVVANRRAREMDDAMVERGREVAELRGAVAALREQVGKYRTRVDEMVRMRPPLHAGGVFLNATNTTTANTTTTKRQPKVRQDKVIRDSIVVAKERSYTDLKFDFVKPKAVAQTPISTSNRTCLPITSTSLSSAARNAVPGASAAPATSVPAPAQGLPVSASRKVTPLGVLPKNQPTPSPPSTKPQHAPGQENTPVSDNLLAQEGTAPYHLQPKTQPQLSAPAPIRRGALTPTTPSPPSRKVASRHTLPPKNPTTSRASTPLHTPSHSTSQAFDPALLSKIITPGLEPGDSIFDYPGTDGTPSIFDYNGTDGTLSVLEDADSEDALTPRTSLPCRGLD